MKRKIIIAFGVLLLLSVGAMAFIKPNHKPVYPTSKPSPDYIKNLKEAGFINLPEFVEADNEIKRQSYKESYGVTYFSEDEMKGLLKTNGWLIAASTFYTDAIPSKEGVLMLSNLEKISAKEPKLDRYDFAKREFLTQENALQRWNDNARMYDIGIVPLVFICAPKEKFNLNSDKMQMNADGTITAKNPDPIALYKIDGGWLELARW